MDKFVVKTPSASSKPKTQSHLPVNITANDRTRNYLEGTFHVDDCRLFCPSCNVCGGQAPGSGFTHAERRKKGRWEVANSQNSDELQNSGSSRESSYKLLIVN